MQRAVSYATRVVAWAWQGCRLFSGPLIAVGLPLLTAWLVPTELGFRLVGFLLQVLGVWIVWVGIRGTREQFEVPGSWLQTKAWLTSFPRFRGPAIIGMAGISSGSAFATGRAHVWYGAAEDATLQQRVDVLEKNLKNVRSDLSRFQKESDDRASAHENEIKRERAEREAADKEIHDKIRETETGGLHLNWSGIWWLLSGTICSSFPEEIAWLLGS